MGSSTCSYFQIPHSVGRTADKDIRSRSYHFYWLKGRGSIRGKEVNFCLFSPSSVRLRVTLFCPVGIGDLDLGYRAAEM